MHSMNKEHQLQAKIHTPFSPMLMEFKMPQSYVDTLNEYGDKISSDSEKSKQLDFSNNLVGNVKQEHQVEDHIWHKKPDPELPTLFGWVGSCTNAYVKTLSQMRRFNPAAEKEKIVTKVMLNSAWIVNSIAGDFNPLHMHNGMLSAAGWLKMPPSVEKDEEREQAGLIEFMHGVPQSLVEFKYPVKPHVGQLFLFPAWLVHEVYPFRGKGIRRTLSFNLDVDLESAIAMKERGI